MDFREAQPQDAANLAALTTQVFLHTYARRGVRRVLSTYVLETFTTDKFRDALGDDRQLFILCEQDAHLIGYVRLDFAAPCPVDARLQSEIGTLYVQEHFARQGIGTGLLNRALAAFERRDRVPVWLSVNHENAAAIAFYQKSGFLRIGSIDFEMEGERHENFVLSRAPA